MVSSTNQQDVKNNPSSVGSKGRCIRTNWSGQSNSTSGSIGSPSTRIKPSMAVTPASANTILKLNQLDIHTVESSEKKKKRRQRATGADKGSRGLRQFSMMVCEKVESKGRTTYNEVANELVAEFADPGVNGQTPDKHQDDEKNIRRRVYDALNVLMAMDIISKDRKEMQWKGFPKTSLNDIDEIKRNHLALSGRIKKKAAYLKELQDQYVGLQNLIKRNEELYSSGNTPNGGVYLPFILVQAQPHATVEVEMSEDTQLVHLDFNSTPFELHDDNYVLKAMNLSGQSNHDDDDMANNVFDQSKRDDMATNSSSMFSSPSRTTVPSVPSILKPRAKHER